MLMVIRCPCLVILHIVLLHAALLQVTDGRSERPTVLGIFLDFG